MAVETLILSYRRPAQLDLLLRSLEGCTWIGPIETIIRSDVTHDGGYSRVCHLHPNLRTRWEYPTPHFGRIVRLWRDEISEPHAMILCDDDFMLEPVEHAPLPSPDNVLCVSLRLGHDTDHCYAADRVQEVPRVRQWDWTSADGDFGYPGSVDGCVFRTGDIKRIIPDSATGPNNLEAAMQGACVDLFSESKPLMQHLGSPCLVTIPVNQVSEQSGVRHGVDHPVGWSELLEAWNQGYRLDPLRVRAMLLEKGVRGSTEVDLTTALVRA